MKTILLTVLVCSLAGAPKISALGKLFDGGLEASNPNGSFPSSGFWLRASAGPGASAICTTTAGRSGNATTTNGLWTFTGDSGNDWWSGPYQETSAYTGAVFTASAWIRTPPNQPWVAGSRAFIRVDFLDSTATVLDSYPSAALTAPNTNWTEFRITTGPAPAGTVRATYTCYLSKTNGTPGISVVNFDDCSLVDTQENLLNPEFEQTLDTPSGPFPTDWTSDNLGQAGAVAIKPADQTDKVLWQFTGTPGTDWWVAIHQQKTSSAGETFRATACLRTPPNQPWVNGTRTFFRVLFINASNHTLASYQSGILTTPNTNWARFEVVTEPAPTNTARVRYTCYLVKPPGSIGQSIVNFDDCSLASIVAPGARVSSRAIGFTATQTQASFELRNTGQAPLSWQIDENVSWLNAPVPSGSIAPLSSQNITLTVDRNALSGPNAITASFSLKTSAKDIPLDVYLDMPAPAPPAAPAEVRFYGRQMRVRDRLPNGTLSEPYHYVIKGSAWSPASIGTPSGASVRRQEFAKWYVADIQLHRAMNANTVYAFLDFGTDATAFQLLDNLYKNGMKAIVTVDEDGSGDSNRLQQIVTAYRSHPAILAWAIGNEWNINFYHQTYATILDSANATESLARQIRALDTNHPVGAIFGDIDIPNLNPLRKSDENASQPISTERIVNDICPTVDFWGLNIYRGASFGNLFTQWASITAKPMFLSEYGTDAYNSTFFDILDGTEDALMQAAFNRVLWHEIATNLSAVHLAGICVGGTSFEWNDEWWKARAQDGASINLQENLGYYGGQLDGFANEEWFGIVAVDRRTRQSYFNLQSDFALVTAAPDLDQDGVPDSWEYQLIDRNNADALRRITDVLPGDDFDGDRRSNLDEYIADTDPAHALSFLRLTSIAKLGGNIRVQWAGGVKATQFLERRNRLTAPNSWATIFTNNPPTPATNQFSDLLGLTPTNQFYRIRVTR